MNIAWGSIMAVIGAYLLISALLAKIWHREYPPYKWLATRSSLIWKGGTHYFYMVIGALLMTLGILWACGVIWAK